jgi:hypothetical protein
VNRVVYDGKGTLDQKQMGLNGEEFTAMNTLNNSAHASFATIVTCIDVSKNRDKWRPIIDKHIAHWKTLCNNLDLIEKGFKAGKSSAQVLAEFKQLSGARTVSATSQNIVIPNMLKIEKAGGLAQSSSKMGMPWPGISRPSGKLAVSHWNSHWSCCVRNPDGLSYDALHCSCCAIAIGLVTRSVNCGPVMNGIDQVVCNHQDTFADG